MKRRVLAMDFAIFFGVFFINSAFAASKIVIGHPACLSGQYFKAGEQAIGGIKACIDWINNVYGGVSLGRKVGHSMVDIQWQGGKRVIVWPEEAQTGKPYWPIPTFADKAKGKKALH